MMQARQFTSLATILLAVGMFASARGQGLTSSNKLTLMNSSHNKLELRSPASAFTNYSLSFPSATPTLGSLSYFSNGSGQLAWLSAGTNGQVLTLSAGVPIWADPGASTGWVLTGNSIGSAYNGTTGNYLGTTSTQPLVIATINTATPQPIEFFTNNVERARIASTGEFLVGTSTPISAVTVNGETYSNTFLTNATASKPPYAEGRFFYDSTDKTLAYYNDHNGVTLNIGQEEWVRVYNATGSPISNGSAVYISGTNATLGLPTIALAKADQLSTTDAIGICTETIPNNSGGYVTAFGKVHQLNTSAFSAGQTLYLSATTAGALTATRPAQPNFTNPVAYVTVANITNGELLVMAGKSRQGAMTTGAIAFGGADGFLRESPNKLFFDSTNGRVGIGTSSPNCLLDIDGDYATRIYNITLSNGENNNISPGAHTCVQVTGPTSPYSITGIAGGTNGKQLHITNLTPKPLTLKHQSTNSTSANRIYNPSGQDVTISDSATITLVYNTTLNAWLVRNASGAISGANGFLFIRKTANQSVTNTTTYQADNDLWFNAAPNSLYEVTTCILDSGIGGVVATFAGNTPTGSEVSGFSLTGSSTNTGNASFDVDIFRMGVLTTGAGTVTLSGRLGFSNGHLLIRTGSTGGKFTLLWGMTTAGAGNTLWILKDSYAFIRLVEQY